MKQKKSGQQQDSNQDQTQDVSKTKGKHKLTPPQDPHAKREASRYEKPIASRELILELLNTTNNSFKLPELATHLHLQDEASLEALRRRIVAMQRDGQIHIDRRGKIRLTKRLDLVHCRIISHRDGYGFAAPIEGGDDFFLSAHTMRQVLDGDKVLVIQTETNYRGRPAANIVEVLERAIKTLPGRYTEENGISYLLPYNPRITQHILIPADKRRNAQSGQVVSVRITDYPTSMLNAKGEIEEILGDHLDPGMEIDIAIRTHQIPWEWPNAVVAETNTLHSEPDESDKVGRIDLRNCAFVTIDGEDAQDFDDAVYCEQEGNDFRLLVAIADVSHYVHPGSAMDEEARNRGNSVYFPERVVPMLPEALSNGLCSLKPHVDRLAMICEMTITNRGEITDAMFYEGVICSHARLTYTQVGTIIEKGSQNEVNATHYKDIIRLHTLYKALRTARSSRGAIDFDTVETRITFNEKRKIASIIPVHRNDAHKLIEECMLAANVAVAQFLDKSKLPILYRAHEGPSPERLSNLRAFLGELALDLPGGETPTPDNYQSVLKKIEDRDDASVIQTMMLRSLSQAIYTPENNGHFGLHYPIYTHFTSPIRRYPDLLIHRAIRHLIRSRKPIEQVRRVKGAGIIAKAKIFPYSPPDMVDFGKQCSLTERRAEDATREVEAWLKCEFLQDKIGEVYDGVISAVTNFGLFVELTGLYIDGLVHISLLPDDYYHFDQPKQRLIGEHTRRTFQLGESLKVRVTQVDLDSRKIDLEIQDNALKRSLKKKPGNRGKKTKANNSVSNDNSRSAKRNKKNRANAKSEKQPLQPIDRDTKKKSSKHHAKINAKESDNHKKHNNGNR